MDLLAVDIFRNGRHRLRLILSIFEIQESLLFICDTQDAL